MNIRKSFYYLIYYYIVCFFILPAHATEIKEERSVYPLSGFMAQSEPIRIKNAGSSYSLFIPLAQRTELESVVLRLQVTNSISLLKERSQLVILMNQHTVAQLPLDPNRPETLMDINIPVEYFRAGYNQLEFRAAQHYTTKCEEVTAPELWTEVNTTNSYLKIKSHLKALSPKLSELKNLFDPKLINDQYHLNLLTANAKMPLDNTHLKWGGLAAQSTGLRLQYVSPLFQYYNLSTKDLPAFAHKNLSSEGIVLPAHLSQQDNILIGTKSELAAFLPDNIQTQIRASYIGIYPILPDKKHFVLIISGDTPQNVTRALDALNFISLPLPDTPYTILTEVDLPKIGKYAGKNQIYENNYYRFSQLNNYKTTSLQGLSPTPAAIEFNISADLFTHDEMAFDLELHFAYAAGMRKDSVLSILVNGQFQSSITLNNDQGAAFTKYKLSLPFTTLKPGKNKITFEAKLRPLVTGECQDLFTDGLQLTIYDDSVIKMPYANHFAILPDLNLFARTGFPYTISGNGNSTYFYIPSQDPKSISSAWTLLAKVVQRKMLPLYEMTLSHQAPSEQEKEADILILGTVDKIDAHLQKTAPFYVSDQFNRIAHVVDYSEQNDHDRNLDLVDRLMKEVHRLLGWKEAITEQNVELMHVVQGHTFGSTGLVLQYQSPFSSEKTVTLFTANSTDILLERINDLVQGAFWDNLQGDVFLWFKRNQAENDLPIYSQFTGNRYFLGNVGLTSMAEYYFSRSPLVWTGVIAIVSIVLALLTIKMLYRFRRRHHANVKDKK